MAPAGRPARGRERLWLFGSAQRLLAQHHRQRAGVEHLHRELVEHDDGHDDGQSSGGPSPAFSSAVADVVRTALGALNELDRELIALTAWEQLSTADAARVVGIAAPTARVRLHRARRRLAVHPDLLRLIEEDDPTVSEREHLHPAVEHL